MTTLRQRRTPPQRVAAAVAQPQPTGAAPAGATATGIPVGTPVQRVGDAGYAPIIPDRNTVEQMAAGKTPKYLVRDDGMVMIWDPITAQDPRFRATNTLPTAHVRAAKAAAIRDSAELDARANYQAEQEALNAKTAMRQAEEDKRRRERLLNLPENENPTEQLSDSIFQIDRADLPQLQKFCDDNEFDVVLDENLPLEQNQAIVRELCEKNLGASMDDV